VDNFADTIKYGRENLSGEKLMLKKIEKKNGVDVEEIYSYNPIEDTIKCAKLKQEILNKVHKDWKLFFMNETGTYDKVWEILDNLKKVCLKNTAFSRRDKEITYNSLSLEEFNAR
jgi:LysM repeat protein